MPLSDAKYLRTLKECTMILPDNIRPENSLYVTGAVVLSVLRKHRRISLNDLYEEVNKIQNISFNVFMLSLDWLYLINAITNNK